MFKKAVAVGGKFYISASLSDLLQDLSTLVWASAKLSFSLGLSAVFILFEQSLRTFCANGLMNFLRRLII